MKLWLSAFTVAEIATKEVVSKGTIIRDLAIRRTELRQAVEADINDLAAERIEGLRLVQRDAIHYTGLMPDKAPQLLTVRLRAEENIAKIQGVLNEKVVHLGKIEHHIKIYDFQDNFPDAIEVESYTISEPDMPELQNGIVVDGAVVEVSVQRQQNLWFHLDKGDS